MLSVVIAARDEERQIADCVSSVMGWADQVIVVDDGSIDRTAVLAEAAGARVLSLQDRLRDHDLSRARPDLAFRAGFVEVSEGWILRMDADERPSPGLLDRLAAVASDGAAGAGSVCGVRFARRYYYFGDWLRYGGWFRSEQVGFFRADAWDQDWPRGIHEQVPVRGSVLTLPAVEALSMAHLEYDDVSQFVSRALLSYARTDGLARARDGGPSRRASLFWRPVRRAAGRFVVRRGFRDGTRGAVAASLLGAYEVCAEAFAWQAGRAQRTPSGEAGIQPAD